MFSTLTPLYKYNHLQVLYTDTGLQSCPCSLYCHQSTTISTFSTLSPVYNHLNFLYTIPSLQSSPCSLQSPVYNHLQSTVISIFSIFYLSTEIYKFYALSQVYNHLRDLYTVTSLYMTHFHVLYTATSLVISML